MRGMTRIGVIGSGNIGATVGEAWRRAGHDVVFASRSPEPPRTVAIADAIAGAGPSDESLSVDRERVVLVGDEPAAALLAQAEREPQAVLGVGLELVAGPAT